MPKDFKENEYNEKIEKYKNRTKQLKLKKMQYLK